MKKFVNILTILFFVSLITFIALVFRPIMNVEEEDCLKVRGKVSMIFESGVKDVSIRLENDRRYFYINRGLEAGLTIEQLRERLREKEIELWYVDHWTPLDPEQRLQHVARVELDDETIYDEIIRN